MITINEIKKLTEFQKEVFMTKEDGKEIKESLGTIQTSLDNLAKDVKDLKQEKTVINYRMKNVENWVDKASPKLGLGFKH